MPYCHMATFLRKNKNGVGVKGTVFHKDDAAPILSSEFPIQGFQPVNENVAGQPRLFIAFVVNGKSFNIFKTPRSSRFPNH